MDVGAGVESAGGMRGAVFHGVGRLGSNERWRAECSETAHKSDRSLPSEVLFSIGGQRFRFEGDAVVDLRDAGLPGAIADVVGSLEKLAARLPDKAKKLHAMPEIEGWSIEVDTGAMPWCVHKARRGSGS